MTDWTEQDVQTYATRFGLTWLTPDLTAQLHAAMRKATTEGQAIPRMPSEFHEPAHIFKGPA